MSSYPSARPLLIEVDLAAVRHNLNTLKKAMADRGQERQVCAVVKADAYGHGLVQVAQALEDEGVAWLGVSSLSEGHRLREAGLSSPILCLGSAFAVGEEHAWDRFKDLQVTPAIYDQAQAESLRGWFARGNRLGFHLKINTGMNRLGFSWTDLEPLNAVRDWAGDQAQGLFTHLARSDEKTPEASETQFQRYFQALEDLGGADSWLHTHTSNSGGILQENPDWPLTLVRPGLALYGYQPCTGRDALDLRPAMEVSARLIQVQRLPKGSAVGYGGEGVLEADGLVGTLPAGYGDGVARGLFPHGVFRHPQGPCPVLGRVSMDLMAVLLPEGARVGDRITLLGPEGPTAEDWAAWEGTIHYEILTRMGRRQGAVAKA